MKVVFYYGSIKGGGAERVITTLSNFLIEKGDEVSIIVHDEGESGYYLDPRVKVYALNCVHMSKNLKESLSLMFGNIKSIKKHIKMLKPDVVLAFDPQVAFIANVACHGIPDVKVIGSERSNPFMARAGWKSKIFTHGSIFLDGFVFQTEGAKHFYPLKTQKKGTVIPNGIFSGFPEYIPEYGQRKPWTVCASGRIVEVKRYDLMVDAVERVIKKYPDIVLDIFGEGNDYDKLKAYIAGKGLQKSIILKGRTKNMTEELVRHRMFLLTSDHEGMPNGLIEAMACGCACISTDCNFGPSELIQDGVNGILTPVGDSKKLADAIESVIEDQVRAEQIAKNASLIRKSHSPESISNRYRDYMKQVIGVK